MSEKTLMDIFPLEIYLLPTIFSWNKHRYLSLSFFVFLPIMKWYILSNSHYSHSFSEHFLFRPNKTGKSLTCFIFFFKPLHAYTLSEALFSPISLSDLILSLSNIIFFTIVASSNSNIRTLFCLSISFTSSFSFHIFSCIILTFMPSAFIMQKYSVKERTDLQTLFCNFPI